MGRRVFKGRGVVLLLLLLLLTFRDYEFVRV